MYGSVDGIPSKPRWGWLYVLAASVLTVLGVADTLVPPGAWRRTLEVGIVVIGFGAIHLWVRANRRALDLAGARHAGFRTIVIPRDAEAPKIEDRIGVTVTDGGDSKGSGRRSGRDGGTRWTSSISA